MAGFLGFPRQMVKMFNAPKDAFWRRVDFHVK
jgi:hypothetical protein